MSKSRCFFLFAAVLAAAPAQSNFDFGVGNTPMSPNDNLQANPFSTTFDCASYQQVIPASALQAQGIQPGWRIASTWIIFDTAVGLHWQSVAVNVAHVTAPAFYKIPGAPFPQVQSYGTSTLRGAAPHVDVAGWNVFDADYGFHWDGVNNIVIEFVVTGGATEYPNGTAYNSGSAGIWATAIGPTLRGSTFAAPDGPDSWIAAAQANVAPGSTAGCQGPISFPTHAGIDMRLVFTPNAINDVCGYYFIIGAGQSAQQTAQGGTTNPALPGNPPLVDEIWYAVQNDALMPRAYTVSGCGSGTNDFDTAIAVYRGACGALTLDAFDNDGCGTPGGPFSVTFDVQPGELVYLAVGRAAGSPVTSGKLFFIGATTSTYAATTVLGPGCGFAGAAPPTLSGTTPTLGSIGTISLTGAPPTSFAVLFLGPPSPNGLFLDTGCPFHVDLTYSFIVQIGLTNVVGQWSFSAPLPTDTNLVGVSVALQAAVLSAVHSPSIGTSSAILLTFGA